MTDLALAYASAEIEAADLLLVGGDLATDDGLRTAVIVSLFTDARAAADDPLPEPGADRRGWWGDAVPRTAGDVIGSRLWLLAREKITGSVLARAREYAEEALAWLVEDRVASAVDVQVEARRPQTLAIGVTIKRPNGPDRSRYDFVWESIA